MNPLQALYGIIGLAVVSGVGWYIYDCESTKTEYAVFKSNVELLGKKAETDKIKREAQDKLAKEKADAELKNLRADNQSLNQQLRDSRARSRALSRPAPRAASPERACFKGALLDAAVTRLVDNIYNEYERRDKELSEIARQCQDAVSGLDSAKVWAQGRQ